MKKKIMFSVGEPSGEMLAIEVIKKLQSFTDGEVFFFGMGGKKLQSHGLELIVDSSDLAVIGFVEVISKWFSLKNALKKMHHELIENPPDILILVDYVEFNLRLGKIAKLLNIPVLFYVSPQIWAWGPKRISRIETSVDKIASIFPFEPELYKSTTINVNYVGNPLTEILPSSLSIEQAREKLKIPTNRKVIGILPGSRISELKKHLPILKKTIINLYKTDIKLIFLVAGVSNHSVKDLLSSWVDNLSQNGMNVKVIYNNTYQIIAASNVVAVASGTATLETALIGSPMVVFYKTSSFSFFILKKIVKVKYISLVNILLKRKTVTELIQKNANPRALTDSLINLLNSQKQQNNQLRDFEEIKEILGKKSASQSVANIVLDMMN